MNSFRSRKLKLFRKMAGSNQGLGVVEVLIAATLLGIFSVSVLNLMESQNKNITRVNQKTEATNLRNSLLSSLFDPAICSYNVSVTTDAALVFDSTAALADRKISLSSFRMGSVVTAPILVQAGQTLGSGLQVNEILVKDLTAAAGGKWSGIWEISFVQNSTIALRPVTLPAQLFTVNAAAPANAVNIVGCDAVSTGPTTSWGLTGNAGTNPAIHFFGTTNDSDLVMRNQAATVVMRIGTTNTSFGLGSLPSTLPANQDNVAFGFAPLQAATNVQKTVAVGQAALHRLVTGDANTAVGFYSFFSTTSGNFNVGIGGQVFYNTVSTNRSTGVGMGALTYGMTDDNTAIGANAGPGWLSTGSQNTFIGSLARTPASSVVSNSTAIGYGAEVVASNTIRLGNPSVVSVVTAGNVRAAGVLYASDRNLKKNIYDNITGLDFILKLRPVSYILRQDADQKRRLGFIAQEVEEIPGLFNGIQRPRQSEEFYSLDYASFVVPLVNAVKELNEKNKKIDPELKERAIRIAKLKDVLSQQKQQLDSLEKLIQKKKIENK